MVILVAVAVAASVPESINYQGRLTNSTGQPVNDTVQLVFTIYADQAATTIVWNETHTDVPVSDGLFTVLLGSITPFESTVFDGATRWLGIAVDGAPSTELLPIVSVAYAHRAQLADSALAAPSVVGGGWVDDGATVRLDASGDKVGIGTNAPVDKVEIENASAGGSSFLRIETSHASDWGEAGLRIETPQNRWHLRMDDDTNNNLPAGALGLRTQNGGFEVMTWTLDGNIGIHKTQPEYPLDVVSDDVAIRGLTTGGTFTAGLYGRAENDAFGVMGTSTDGRGVYGASTTGFGGYFLGPKHYLSSKVGIGTESPTHTLTVNGALAVQEAEATKFHIDYYNSGLNFCETSVADYRLMLKAGGNVGIGTGSPQKKLHVAGSMKVNDTLTAGAIFSSSIVDEPGVATAAQTGTFNTDGSDTVFTGQITVPGPGYIWVMGTAAAWLDHSGIHLQEVNYGFNNSYAYPAASRIHEVGLFSDVAGGHYGLPLACQSLFTVSSAGTYTMYFWADIVGSQPVEIIRGKMTMVYFPTLYSAKGGEVSAETDAPSVPGAQIVGVSPSSADESAGMAEILSELSALRSRVDSLEQGIRRQ
jgi:hypothetical protein